MKTLFIGMVLTFGFFLTSCGVSEDTTPLVTQDTISVQPESKVDIYGKITSIEWNEVNLLQIDTSKDPTFNMTPTEKQKYMQALDEATRMALKEEINAATLGEVKVIIPVGIPMIQKTAQWPDAPNTEASLADLSNGKYISIWLSKEVPDQKIAEFVKIAFSQ